MGTTKGSGTADYLIDRLHELASEGKLSEARTLAQVIRVKCNDTEQRESVPTH